MPFIQKLSRQETPNSVGGVGRECIIIYYNVVVDDDDDDDDDGDGDEDEDADESLRNRNVHGHFTRAMLHGNLQEKCRTPSRRHSFCASLRGRNAHGKFTRAILYGNSQGTCRTLIPRPTFSASLRSRNAHDMDMSQEAIGAEIYRENAGRFR